MAAIWTHCKKRKTYGMPAGQPIARWQAYNVMDGNVGAQECNFEHNIKRIRFLQNYAMGLEFDG